MRGDVDADGAVTFADMRTLLNYLFPRNRYFGLRGVRPALTCLDAADVNDDGVLNLTDAVAIGNVLTFEESVPPPPYPAAGKDPSEDGLSCESYP